MDASLLSDAQLSALELMMSHADEAHILSQGAPKRKRRQKTVAEMFPDGFTYEEEYVGTGSRAKNREMRARKAEKPDNRAVVKALEVAFAEQSDDSEQVIKSVKEGTETSKEIAKVLGDWLKWSQNRAFLEDHKSKAAASISPPSTDRGTGTELSANEPDADFPPDVERDRNGNKRKRNGRRRPRSRLRTRARMFGRSRGGKLLGLAAMAATGLGIGAWLKHDSSEDLEGADPHDENQVDSSTGQPTAKATPANPSAQPTETPRVSAKTPEQLAAQEKADTMWDVGSSAAWMLGGAKRIPFVGTAITVADGAREAKKIHDDDSLTDAEKTKAQTANVTQTAGGAIGATAGAALGGAVGSIVPFFGTAIGATLGGMLGGYLGDKIGGYVAEKISDETDSAVDEDRKRREKQDQEDARKEDNKPSPFFLPFNLFGGGGNNGRGRGFNNGAGPVRFPGATSARASDIAKQVLASDKIGGVSEQFESGGRGVGTVSSGAGDLGGVSYGKHQLASNTGSMTQFLNSPEAKNLAGDFGGLTPGTAQFNERYKQIAGTRGKEMEDAQYQYLVRTHYAPTAERLEKNLGIDANKQGRAFKEMVYSTSMQYGGNAASKIERALKGKDLSKMSEQEIVEAVQKDKLANVQNDFRSSSSDVQQGVAARTMKELEVLKQLDAKKAEPEVAKTSETQVAKSDVPTDLPTGIVKPGDGEVMMKASRTDEGKTVTSAVTAPIKKEDGLIETPEQVEARLSKTGDAPRTPTQANASKEDLEAARANVHKEITGNDISPAQQPTEIPWGQKTVQQKQDEIEQMKGRVDFLKRKNAYIKAHPEITRADDKKVDEIVREQQRQSQNVQATSSDGGSVVRAETLGTKEQPVVGVERAKPLEPMPEPVADSPAPIQTADNSGGGARSVPANGGASTGTGGGKSTSLDDIPVIIEDPMLNFINLGYV